MGVCENGSQSRKLKVSYLPYSFEYGHCLHEDY